MCPFSYPVHHPFLPLHHKCLLWLMDCSFRLFVSEYLVCITFQKIRIQARAKCLRLNMSVRQRTALHFVDNIYLRKMLFPRNLFKQLSFPISCKLSSTVLTPKPSNPILHEIMQRIKINGPISVAEYMKVVLTGPRDVS